MAKQQIHGIAVGSRVIGVTSLEEGQEGWEVVRHQEMPLETDEDDPANHEAGIADALRPHAAELRGSWILGLPARSLLLRVVDLPTDDPEEIEGMVNLQVDKFSPFPTDQLVISHEELAATGQGTRVLIAAAQRGNVEALGDVVRELGGRPSRLDVDVLGWWHLIQKAGAMPTSGGHVVVLQDREDTLLLVVRDGAPLLIRSLGPADAMPGDAFCDMVAEETSYALTSIETEWGAISIEGCTVWHRDDPPRNLVERMCAECGTGVVVQSIESIPPVSEGLALRAVNPRAEMLDLAPAEWEQQDRAGQVKRRLVGATTVLLTIWLIAVIGFAVALGTRKAKLADLSAHLASLQAPAEEVRLTRDKVLFLERYTNTNYSALDTLRDVCLAMPEGIDLNLFSYNRSGTITIRGAASAPEPIYQFQDSLEMSDLLKDVQPGPIKDQNNRHTFSFKADSAEEDL